MSKKAVVSPIETVKDPLKPSPTVKLAQLLARVFADDLYMSYQSKLCFKFMNVKEYVSYFLMPEAMYFPQHDHCLKMVNNFFLVTHNSIMIN